jgi:hypothetical protein
MHKSEEILVNIMYGEHPTNKLQFRIVEWFMQQVSPSFLETNMFHHKDQSDIL